MNVNLVRISPPSFSNCRSHVHEEWEIVLNLEGEGETIIGNKEYSFQAGTIICQPPNIPHSKKSKTNFRDIYIIIDNFTPPNNESIPIFLDDEEKSFETLMFMALKTFYKKEYNYAALLNSQWETMYQLLISWCKKGNRNNDIELFISMLIENYSNPEFIISDALSNCNYSKDHFRRMFKSYTNMTPTEYLTYLRITSAEKRLLQEKNFSISEIALSSGFTDQLYFSRVFKKATGFCPQEYVKNINGIC